MSTYTDVSHWLNKNESPDQNVSLIMDLLSPSGPAIKPAWQHNDSVVVLRLWASKHGVGIICSDEDWALLKGILEIIEFNDTAESWCNYLKFVILADQARLTIIRITCGTEG